MRVASLDEFWESHRVLLAELRKLEAKTRIEYAHVVGIADNGRPLLRFAGEQETSDMFYPEAEHYTPRIGQRVQLVDGIIQGGVKKHGT